MSLEQAACLDDVGLSAVLRNLAGDARRILAHGASHPGEIASITRRIRHLRDRVRAHPPSALEGWLDGLQRKLEGPDGYRAGS